MEEKDQEPDRDVFYVWKCGKTHAVYPVARRSVERAKDDAEKDYRRRNRAQYPDAGEQRLEWVEKTNPLVGFRGRFWALYAQRRASSGLARPAGQMFSTDYTVCEMWLEDE